MHERRNAWKKNFEVNCLGVLGMVKWLSLTYDQILYSKTTRTKEKFCWKFPLCRDGPVKHTRGKSFWKNFISSRDGAEKSTQTRWGWERLENPTPTTEWCQPPLWPPTQCTCIPNSLCYLQTKWTRDASALRWRTERGPASFHSGVGFWRLSHPHLVCVPFSAPSLLKIKFFRNVFPVVSVLFLRWFLNQFSNTTRFTSEYDITLQLNSSSLPMR